MHTYRPLLAQGEIRLLELLPGHTDEIIQCTLTHQILGQSPSYTAISYTWGSTELVGDVKLDGYAVPVRENLYQLLRHLRQPYSSLVLWVDALCIDQDSFPEKNNQVPLMGKIYSLAKSVFIWLGVHADASERYFDSLSTAPARASLPTPQIARDAAICLYGRPYWKRTWIVQEIVLASNIRVICGDRSCTWSDFQPWGNTRTPNDPTASDHAFTNVVALRHAGVIIKLRRLLFRFHLTQCSDPRDLVYSLLNFAEDTRDQAHGIVIDYSCTIEALFVQTLAFCSGLGCRALLSGQPSVECLRFCDTLATRLGADLEASLVCVEDALNTNANTVLTARLTCKSYLVSLRRFARVVTESNDMRSTDVANDSTPTCVSKSHPAPMKHCIRSIPAKEPLNMWTFDRVLGPSDIVYTVDFDSPNEPAYQLCCVCSPTHYETDVDDVDYYRYNITALGIIPNAGSGVKNDDQNSGIREQCVFLDSHLQSLVGREASDSTTGYIMKLTLQELVGICQFGRTSGAYLPWALSQASTVDHWKESRDIFTVWQ